MQPHVLPLPVYLITYFPDYLSPHYFSTGNWISVTVLGSF